MATIDWPMHVYDKVRNDTVEVSDVIKAKIEILMTNGETSHKSTGVERWVDTNKGKGKEVKPVLRPIPRYLSPFSQRFLEKSRR